MEFCSPFDEAIAQKGPPAVFLIDREGLLRFDANWSRDAYGKVDSPLEPGWSWRLLRDHGSGFVVRVLVTSPDLLLAHDRCDVRCFASEAASVDALRAFGRPPVSREAWS